jgi:hypothetical protein
VENALPTSTILTLGGANGAGSAPGRKTELNLNGNDQTLAGLTNSGGGSLRTFVMRTQRWPPSSAITRRCSWTT